MPLPFASRALPAALLAALATSGARPLARAPLPRFPVTVLLEPTADSSANASIGDVDGDGHPDIVLAKGRHWPSVDRVLLGDGRGGIRATYDLGPLADRTYTADLVDLDGDGDLDLVVSNDRPDPKRLYFNDGTGHFGAPSTYGAAEWPTRNATVADVDGDGRPDIVVANRFARGPGADYVCLNRGAGRFDGDCIAFADVPATTIAVADLDGDGDADLVVPHRNGGQGQVYLGAAGADLARLARRPFGPPDAAMRAAEAVDLDGDGRVDLVTIDERRGAALHRGAGDGTFAPGIPLGDTTRTPYALAVGDVTGDGRPDVVVGHVRAPLVVHVNAGGGRFVPEDVGDGAGTAYGIAIGDLDGDGRADLVVARSDAPNVLYRTRAAAR